MQNGGQAGQIQDKELPRNWIGQNREAACHHKARGSVPWVQWVNVLFKKSWLCPK